MVPPSQHFEVMQIIAVTEYVATLIAIGTFGLVYATFVNMNLGYLTFVTSAVSCETWLPKKVIDANQIYTEHRIFSCFCLIIL